MRSVLASTSDDAKDYLAVFQMTSNDCLIHDSLGSVDSDDSDNETNESEKSETVLLEPMEWNNDGSKSLLFSHMSIRSSIQSIETQKVHVRVLQRNSRKRITVIEGLVDNRANWSLAVILRELKKDSNCSGTIRRSKSPLETDKIQLTGDQRQKVVHFLVRHRIVNIENIDVHGPANYA